jgi:uncharacterized protein YdeI (YjbR/CyaY-like superfamily)
MSPRPEAPLLHFEDAEAFEAWVAAQPEDWPGVWLRIARKGAGAASVTYGEALIAAGRMRPAGRREVDASPTR